MADPPHPGEFVRTEILDPRDLTVVEAAQVLGVSRPALSAFLNGRSDLSGMMALRIEKAFGVKVETLMRMQMAYDIAGIRRHDGEIGVEPYGTQAVCEAEVPYGEETLSISDSIVRRLREEAARRGITLSELVEEGLRRVLAKAASTDDPPDTLPPLPTWRGGEPLVDISDRDALYRVMEEE